MNLVMQRSLAGGVVLSFCVLSWTALFGPWTGPGAQSARAQATRVEAPQTQPPIDGRVAGDDKNYAGINKCAACHFQQYRDWQTTPHGNAYEKLPQKYKNDAECLECHSSSTRTTTVGARAGAVHPIGVACESCHGAGNDHAEYALSFVGREQLITEDELGQLRSKIQRLAVGQCVKCHTSKAHKPHPEYDREKPLPTTNANAGPARSFFAAHGEPAN